VACLALGLTKLRDRKNDDGARLSLHGTAYHLTDTFGTRTVITCRASPRFSGRCSPLPTDPEQAALFPLTMAFGV